MSDEWNENWKKDQYNDPIYRRISEAEGTYALREAWKKFYGDYPSDKSLALLWAQVCLETGRFKKMYNNNFGNIKKRHYKKLSWKTIEDDGNDWTMFATGENIWNKSKQKMDWHWFEPPHYQTHFRSYKTSVEGAEDYIKFVSQKKRYIKAWREVVKGNAEKFSMELHKAGYYTANPKTYTKGVVRLVKEFLGKKEELLAWKPKPESIIPEAESEEISEIVMEEIKIIGYTPNEDQDDDEEIVAVVQPVKGKITKTKGKLSYIIVAGLVGTYVFFKDLVISLFDLICG